VRGHAAGIGKVERQNSANAVETGNKMITRRSGACTEGKGDIRRIAGMDGAGGVHSSESKEDLRDDAESGRMYSESMLERGEDSGDSKRLSPCLPDDGRSARTRSKDLEKSTGNMLERLDCCTTS